MTRKDAIWIFFIAPGVAALSTVSEAKAAVRAALAANDGQTKAPAVVASIDALAAMNPTAAPARTTALLLGEWRQINSPEYPGMLGFDESGNPKYTLGRLAFNLFEPNDLVCSISDILNPLRAREGQPEVIDYSIEIPLAFEGSDGAAVRGTLANFAECAMVSDERISVKFLGGELRPADGTTCPPEWADTFADALQTAKRGVGTRLSGWLMKRMMGLERPTGMASGTGVMSYSMSKAPKGWLDVMFLDDEWRITRGNRGSIVVAERVK